MIPDLDWLQWCGVAGLVVVALIVLCALCVIAVIGWQWLQENGPFFICREPQSPMEMITRERTAIVSAKDGGRVVKPEHRIYRRLRVTLLGGLSSGGDAKWFFGLLRFEKMEIEP